MRTLVLPQLDGSQMIARIILGRIHFVLAFPRGLRPPIICDFASQIVYRQRLPHEFHAHTKGYARLFKDAQTCESRSSKVYLALCHSSDIRDLSAEQLQYIPKIALLRVYDDYIEHVWDKLPRHAKTDSEVRAYCLCYRRALQSVAADAYR